MVNEYTVDVSIIIVRYRVVRELFDCLDSLRSSKTNSSYEVILVDNDVERPVEKDIKKNYKWVKYVKAPRNLGFGPGNNFGAKFAKGKYLYFVNSDTSVFPDTVDNLIKFLEKRKDAGVVSPLLLQENNIPFKPQGAKILTPLRGMFLLSFINKLFPGNPISKSCWVPDRDKTKPKEVDVIAGTAVMIRRDLYDNLGGWDEHFFIYFEEFDLCKRIREKGYKNFIIPDAKIIHLWERSTKSESEFFNKIFRESRFYYFKKHYGIVNALLVELFARFSKYTFAFLPVFAIGVFLLFYKISSHFTFISDQEWFYLAARDMMFSGNIPLVSIASSHPWLHQGPVWTYMLALVLWIWKFNPVSGAIFSAFLSVISLLLFYRISTEMFSKRTGLIAALLYATSPLVISSARMPYHTSPIPLLAIVFLYTVYKWIKGNIGYFPVIILTLALLYNFELATFPLWFVLFILLGFGFLKKTKWYKGILHKKILFLSLIAYLIPMTPFILYDIHHSFPQTIGFIIWLGYRILVLFGYPPLHPEIPSASFPSLLLFTADNYQKLIFITNAVVAITVFIFSFGFFYKSIFDQLQRKNYDTGYFILGLVLTISLVGYFAAKTESGAYLPIFYPIVILVTAIWFDSLMKSRPLVFMTFLAVCLLSFSNSYALISQNYFFGKNNPTYTDRLRIASDIVSEAKGRQYNVAIAKNKIFTGFVSDYAYLTWWLGNGPSKKHESLLFIIRQDSGKILIQKKEIKHSV